MRIFKYPVDEKTGFRGTVDLAVPNYRERIKLALEHEERISKVKETEDKFDSATIMLDLAEAHVKGCDLEHVASGEEITDFEDLGCFSKGSEIINALGAQILSGLDLGEDSGQQSE